jgi:hypothetical protein
MGKVPHLRRVPDAVLRLQPSLATLERSVINT